ncbi:MAG TPA: YcxB family protein [Candidatus Methylacidiphilales bacterium]|jgi:hypothetical protein|nr:YcxB family protein [Candidatus Methylacidiphilales bacterium]
MEINLKAQLTTKDYADAQRLHSGFRVYFIVALMALAIISLIVCSLGNTTDFQAWVWAGCIWLIWLLFFCVMLPRKMAKQAAKIFSQQKTLQIPYECRITDEKLYGHSEIGESRMSWEDFHKWKGNEKLILVYQSDRIFHMFPRRWFASDDEFQSFKNLLTRTIGPAGKGRKRT